MYAGSFGLPACQGSGDEIAVRAGRRSRFHRDWELNGPSATDADYCSSGYSRGHMVPAADQVWSEASCGATFLFSNVVPQKQAFNAGRWRQLESSVRPLAATADSLVVFTGPVFCGRMERIGANHVAVPCALFKLVLAIDGARLKMFAVVLPNEGNPGTGSRGRGPSIMRLMARIAMGQLLVEGGAVEANLARAEEFITRAAVEGCDVIVLPECLDTGWTHPSAREDAFPIPGPTSDRLAAAAARHGIHVAAGITERCGDRIFNAAVLIGSTGAILAHHRKINELDIAHHLYSRGDRLMVADTPFGKVGLTICADNFPDSLDLSRSLARMGARYILSPCAWAVDAGHDNTAEPYGDLWRGAYTTLTTAHAVTIVGVSNVGWLVAGPWKGRKCIGCSMAMGPGGTVLAQGPYGESAQGLFVFETG